MTPLLDTLRSDGTAVTTTQLCFSTLFEALRNENVDVVVVFGPAPNNFRFLAVECVRLGAMVRDDNPCAMSQSVTLQDLADRQQVALNLTDLEQYRFWSGPPNPELVVDSPDAMFDAIVNFGAWAMAPNLESLDGPRPFVRFVPITNATPVDLGFVTTLTPSTTITRLLELAATACRFRP